MPANPPAETPPPLRLLERPQRARPAPAPAPRQAGAPWWQRWLALPGLPRR